MAYRSRYRRGRRYGRGRRYRPRRGRFPMYKRKLYTGRPELKTHLVEFNGLPISTTLTTRDLCSVAQGITSTMRIGQKIYVKYLKLDILIRASASDGNNSMRMTIGQFPSKKQPVSTTLAPTPDGCPSSWWQSWAYNTGIKLYYNRIFTLSALNGANATDNNGPGVEHRAIRKKIRINRYIEFNSVNHPVGGYLFMWHTSDSAVVPFPALYGTSRIYFYDA